jgi:hypothetical protein
VRTTGPRTAEVATAELDAELVLLGTLDEQDWRRPTDCVGWDVHDLTAHLVGEYEEITRPWVLLRRLRKGHRRYPHLSRLDAHNQQQLDELGDQSGGELTVRTDAVGYLRAVSGRDDHPALEVDGDPAAAAAARVVF